MNERSTRDNNPDGQEGPTEFRHDHVISLHLPAVNLVGRGRCRSLVYMWISDPGDGRSYSITLLFLGSPVIARCWLAYFLVVGSMVEHEHRDTPHRDMSNAPGTLRGATPKRAGLPFDTAMNSPSTSIPRPKLESQQSEMSGHSTISASRQKQSKRDEVSDQQARL